MLQCVRAFRILVGRLSDKQLATLELTKGTYPRAAEIVRICVQGASEIDVATNRCEHIGRVTRDGRIRGKRDEVLLMPKPL